MTFLLQIPAVVLLLSAVAIAIAGAGAGQIYVHHRFSSQDFIAHNEVGGIIIAVAGTLFAVVLGFLTVVVWQEYTDARRVVVLESSADIDAWHTAVGLPPSVRERVRADVMRYARIMIESEWPEMRRGTFDPEAAIISMDAIDAAGSLVPANMGEANAQTATLQELGILHDARQQRIAIIHGGVTLFEWVVLLISAACIICFCWLFGLRNRHVQLLMTSTVVTIVVSTLVLLFELQYPFRSDIGIRPDAWKDAVAHIHEMQAGTIKSMKM